MTAQISAPSTAVDIDPLHATDDPFAAAHEHVAGSALRDTAAGQRLVGLELEFHLVDLRAPARRPGWECIQRLVAGLPPMPSGSSVTVEPGGQLELSTPPTVGIAASVEALRADRIALRDAVQAEGFGTAPLGTDPARPARRVNPNGRYVAMEQHFAALHCAPAGRTMMTASAALQVNLDAGPAAGWSQRLGRIRDLGPLLVAISACSPLLSGTASGWRSMRQQAWHGIDPGRTAAVPGADPAADWADYALDAPVMLVRRGGVVTPVTERVCFGDWLRGRAPVLGAGRPGLADLDYHLTTLFPPVRPRGYVELRCLDAVPDRWWPALAAIVVTLVDDDVACERAAELSAPVRDAWTVAARDGLADPALRAAAAGCVEIAAQRCAPPLRAEVEAYAALVTDGRTPGDELAERAAAVGPLAALEEEARA